MKLGNGYNETVQYGHGWKKQGKGPIVDFFGHEIEVGDRYFYGSPPTAGIVILVLRRRIVIDRGANPFTGVNETMNCKSPEKGICIDKVEPGIE